MYEWYAKRLGTQVFSPRPGNYGCGIRRAGLRFCKRDFAEEDSAGKIYEYLPLVGL